MAIKIKTQAELNIMRIGGQILAWVFSEVENALTDGISTKEIDSIIFNTIKKKNAKPSFKGYGRPPFPASSCISINDEVIHGVPSKKVKIKNGDIVGIDIGVCYQGYHTDSACTFEIGDVSEEAHKLVETTTAAFFEGIKTIRDGVHLGDVSAAIQKKIEGEGFGLVREFQGHGIGTALHEPPSISNVGVAGNGVILKSNMVLAIEPMVTMGHYAVYIKEDNWTVATEDRSLSAHYEHTVAVTDFGVEILTAAPDNPTVNFYMK